MIFDDCNRSDEEHKHRERVNDKRGQRGRSEEMTSTPRSGGKRDVGVLRAGIECFCQKNSVSGGPEVGRNVTCLQTWKKITVAATGGEREGLTWDEVGKEGKDQIMQDRSGYV